MASKKNHGGDGADTNDSGTNETDSNPTLTAVREMLPRIDIQPLLDRTQAMLVERPGITLAAAVGTGFFLGVTLFSKVGRIALAGVFGLAAELAMQKVRANYLEQNASA